MVVVVVVVLFIVVVVIVVVNFSLPAVQFRAFHLSYLKLISLLFDIITCRSVGHIYRSCFFVLFTDH